MIDHEHYPVTSGQLLIKKKDKYYIVKDVKTKTQGRANEDLKELLLLCDGTRTVIQIAEELSRDFEESDKEVRKKVAKSVEFLKDLRFLTLMEEPVHVPVIIRDADLEWPLDMAYVEVTNQCNLRCIHCYKGAGAPFAEELNTEEWRSVIDDLKNLGIMTIAFTGGEPLMRPDIFQILEYARENVIGVTLFTNGTLVTEEVVAQLEKIGPEKIMVSIDGATKETHEKIRGKNTFEKTVEGISMLTENGFSVRTNTVVYTGNIDELDVLIQMLLDLDVTEMIFDRFMYAGRGKEAESLIPPLEMGEVVAGKCSTVEEEAPQQFKLQFTSEMQESDPKFSFCGVGTSMMTIKADGDVVLCPVLSDSKYTAGNVKNAPLEDLWLNSTIFEPLRKSKLDDMQCGSCSQLSECRGGCKARVLHHYNNVSMPDPWMCATRGKEYPDE